MPKPIVDSVTPSFARPAMIFEDLVVRVRADVRVTVGEHDHARDRAGLRGPARLLVGEVDARRHRRSSRRRAGRRSRRGSVACARCSVGCEHDARRAGVGHERDGVAVGRGCRAGCAATASRAAACRAAASSPTRRRGTRGAPACARRRLRLRARRRRAGCGGPACSGDGAASITTENGVLAGRRRERVAGSS